MNLRQAFLPNKAIDRTSMSILTIGTVVLLLGLWIFNPSPIVPNPLEVITAFVKLWTEEGLGLELWTSFKLSMFSLFVSTFVVLILAYSTRWSFMRPLVVFITKCRFIGLVGMTYIFTRMTGGGFELKMAMMVFGIVPFFLTSMYDAVSNIPQAKYDYARTLQMSELHIVWEVVILGTLDTALRILQQNASICWMMLTMVEAISRAEGGVGALLNNQTKHFYLDAVFAIQFCLLGIGLFQDYIAGVIRNLSCPHSALALGKR